MPRYKVELINEVIKWKTVFITAHDEEEAGELATSLADWGRPDQEYENGGSVASIEISE